MPADDSREYYLTRQRQALAMASAASDPAVQNIHLEMAKRYADIVHAGEIDALAISRLRLSQEEAMAI